MAKTPHPWPLSWVAQWIAAFSMREFGMSPGRALTTALDFAS